MLWEGFFFTLLKIFRQFGNFSPKMINFLELKSYSQIEIHFENCWIRPFSLDPTVWIHESKQESG